MPQLGVVDGLAVPKRNQDEKLASTVNLYIGIFFDGTNNNKYQVMLGKMFRRKKIFEKAVKRQNSVEGTLLCTNGGNKYVCSVEGLLKYSRAEVEEIFRGAFTKSELEFLYFGYGDINDTSNNSYDTFIENKNKNTLSGENHNELSAKPDDNAILQKRKMIYRRAAQWQTQSNDLQCTSDDCIRISSLEELLKYPRAQVEVIFKGVFTQSELDDLYYDERDALYQTARDLDAHEDISTKGYWGKIESFKDAAAQNVTYTNVAILESLYKCENKIENGEITEKHISIYVEGSGSDMQFEASSSGIYKGTIGVAGLGLGTGSTGVVSKIRKASVIVNRLLDQYKCIKDVKVNFHFDLFGFSRGATCARIMAYLINPDPASSKSDKAYSGGILKNPDDFRLLTTTPREFLKIDEINEKTIGKEIRFMGIFDTVSSIGVKDENSLSEIMAMILGNAIEKDHSNQMNGYVAVWDSVKKYINPSCSQLLGYLADSPVIKNDVTNMALKITEYLANSIYFLNEVKLKPLIQQYLSYVQSKDYKDKFTEDLAVLHPSRTRDRGKNNICLHKDNVIDFGLWATSLAKDVVHICAMDEYRQNFALVDIQSSLDEERGKEIFLPGCHTDIGGGASIGMEDVKIINKGSKKYLTPYFVHSKAWLEKDKLDKENKGKLLKPIDVESLKEIGWLNLDSKTNSVLDFSVTGNVYMDEDETYYNNNYLPSNVIMHRHVTPGYSNVALNYMREQAAEDSFNEVPKSYQVPKELNKLYEQLNKDIKGCGRFFVYPKEPDQYSELRRKFIHFSFNEQLPKSTKSLADNVIVNGPEYTEINHRSKGKIKVLSRIIYPGTLTDLDERHMFDYE